MLRSFTCGPKGYERGFLAVPVMCAALFVLPAGAEEAAKAPDRTPGYVEEMQSIDDDRLETGEIARWGEPQVLGIAPTSPEAQRRAEAFVEKLYPKPSLRLSGVGGAVGFSIDY